MNQSNFKEGSSSCRCTMTLRGENEETERIVLRILSKRKNMLENSSKELVTSGAWMREDVDRYTSSTLCTHHIVAQGVAACAFTPSTCHP